MQSGKIAFVSKNKKNILGSFGQSKYFEVFTIDNFKVVNQETRLVDTETPSNVRQELLSKSEGIEGKELPAFSLGVFNKSKEKHLRISRIVNDCNYVVARDMCHNAWESIEYYKMQPILTDSKEFQPVIDGIINGVINDNKEGLRSRKYKDE